MSEQFSIPKHVIIPIIGGVSVALFLGIGNWIINTDRVIQRLEIESSHKATIEECERIKSGMNLNSHEIDEHDARIEFIERNMRKCQ